MTRRLTNKTAYKVEYRGINFLVVLTHLRNGYCGQLRFEAEITNLDDFYQNQNSVVVYRFNGSYCGDKGEAEMIVETHYKLNFCI